MKQRLPFVKPAFRSRFFNSITTAPLFNNKISGGTPEGLNYSKSQWDKYLHQCHHQQLHYQPKNTHVKLSRHSLKNVVING